MVHRDLKPENIMLTKEGVVKLLDLGVAKISGGLDTLKTQTNAVFGTPAYISPEQAVDSSTVDARADVYSLGVILFELLCGRRPYAGNDPMEILKQLLDPSPIPDVRTVNGKVSPKVAETVARMCAKRLEDRIASPKALLETFARIGYALPATSGSEIAAEAAPEGEDGPSVADLVAGLSAKPADKSLELETQDAEIQEFISRLKRRKRRRWLLAGIGALALLATGLLLFLLLR